MSLYDKASLIFSGAAGAGNEEVAYNIKPVEKLKVDEYIKNGNFDDDSVWIKTAGVTISDGKARMSDTSDVYRRIEQQDVFTIGKTYKVSVNLEIKKGTVKIGTELKANSIGVGVKSGQHSFYFTADANDLYIAKDDAANGYDIAIDNVSVREVEQKANDFSFVRASDLTATHEGADGLIKKTRENLLLQSNQFDTTWAGLRRDVTSGQGGYDGSSNAWLLESNAASTSYLEQTVSASGVQTFSVYAKSGTSDFLILYNISTSTNSRAWFDLSGDGSVETTHSTDITAKIESIGSGWHRCSVTYDKPVTQVRIYVGESDNDFTSADGENIYIQNSQLEQGLVATPYIDRTDSYSKSTAGIQEDEPRYDYSLDNDAPPALLYEPQRINLVHYSEAVLGDDWIKSSNYTVANNAATSPEGVDNAVKCTIPSANGQLRFRSAVDANTDYVWSFYVKRGTATQLKYSVYDNTNAANIVAQTSYYSDTSSSEWKRIEVPFTTPAGCSSVGVYPDRDSQGNGTVFFWGFQLEKGSCVTSYIPTYGSAGTRKGDVIPQYVVPKLNTNKYTFFVHSHTDRVVADNRAPRLSGGTGNSALMGHFITGSPSFKKQFFLYENDATSALSKATFGSFEAGDETKYAFVVDNIGLEAKLFIDGLLRETISLSGRVDAKQVSIGNSDGNPDRIKSIMYFPEALEDADVVSLTT